MAHTNKVISKININNTLYDIHDSEAIHSLADLGLDRVLQFKGVVASTSDLPTTGSVGDVYHVTDTDSEVVWTDNEEWEEFGSKFITDHKHTYSSSASLSGSATVTGTNASSSVSGSATVAGANEASSVSASGSVSVPTVSKEAQYIKVSSSIGDVAVAGNGIAAAITGFGTHTTATVPTALTTTTIKNPTVTTVTIPNVTGNASVTASKISANTSVTASKVGVTAGSAAAWSADVSDDGVLSFAFTANTPTAVTATDVTASKITASDVTATKTTLGTALSASSVSTSDVTVATGAMKSTAKAITALGTATTANALTGVKVSTQPTISVSLAAGTSDDGVYAGDEVTIGSSNKTVSVSGTAAAQKWTQSSGTISGTAAAQTWTQKTGTAAVSGTVSGTTGLPQEA